MEWVGAWYFTAVVATMLSSAGGSLSLGPYDRQRKRMRTREEGGHLWHGLVWSTAKGSRPRQQPAAGGGNDGHAGLPDLKDKFFHEQAEILNDRNYKQMGTGAINESGECREHDPRLAIEVDLRLFALRRPVNL